MLIACFVVLALFTPALLMLGCSPQQAVDGMNAFVNGLGHLVELHIVAVIGSLGLAAIAARRMRH